VKGGRNPRVKKLVGGQPESLAPGAGFGAADRGETARRPSAADDTESGPGPEGREAPGVAMGEDTRAGIEAGSPFTRHRPRGGFLVAGESFGRGEKSPRGLARLVVENATHAGNRGGKIDGRRTRGGEARERLVESAASLRLRPWPKTRLLEDDAVGGRDAEKRRPADDELADRGDDVVDRAAFDPYAFGGKTSLIEESEDSGFPDESLRKGGTGRTELGHGIGTDRGREASFYPPHGRKPRGFCYSALRLFPRCAMDAIDTLLVPRWILPIEPAGACLEGHALAVDRGRIVALLPADEAARLYAPRHRWDLPRHVLLPGFVNAHTHAAMTLLRGRADDLPLERWLRETIWPLEAKHVDAAFVRDGTELAIAEMLRNGVTTFNDMYFFPEETIKVAQRTGVRLVAGLVVIDVPTRWAERAEDYLERGLAVHDRYKGAPRLGFALAPHAPYSVPEDLLRRLRVLADELDLPCHIHLHETAAEIETALETTGERPLARLERLGFCDGRLIAVHMTQLTPTEIASLATRPVAVVHCPESNLKLASGIAPVARLLEHGVPLGLGTDGAASNNDLDLLGETRTAALLAKAAARDAAALPASRALELATLGGARALGLAARVGSLRPGKDADLCAIDLLSDPTRGPIYDPQAHLVYAASARDVTHVWVEGELLVEDRRLLRIDVEDLARRTEAWRRRLEETPGSAP
jgi:5-methylthioadenosine/S-adenosylhomocysteine deaminase